jgi:TetR/AcrR family transcriptional repressor of nem operon
MLERGYPATTVDQICEAAGVTKGAFFHYFDSKEAVGRAVIERFVSELVETFGSGPFREIADPLERVYGYIGFTIDVCKEAILQDGCILGLSPRNSPTRTPRSGPCVIRVSEAGPKT